jgi:hypothetical protein
VISGLIVVKVADCLVTAIPEELNVPSARHRIASEPVTKLSTFVISSLFSPVVNVFAGIINNPATFPEESATSGFDAVMPTGPVAVTMLLYFDA